MPPKRWKTNKLLSNFLKGKARRASSGSQRRTKPVFSLLSRTCTENQPPQDIENDDNDLDDGMDFGGDDVDNSDANNEDSDINPSPRKRRRRARKINHSREVDSWKRVLPSLIKSYTSNLAMPKDQLCMSCPNRATHRCLDCSYMAFFCEECCSNRHRYIDVLHIPEKWTQGQYVISPFEDVVLPLTHVCETAYQEKVTIVTLNGM